MERSVITNENTKSINKILKKYSEVEISSGAKKIKGSFKITRYRHYKFHDEIDIEFNGEVLAKYSSLDENKWYTSEIYTQKSFSKIRINKFIKMCLFNEIKTHCNYFGIKITVPSKITKINWI
jgi:hypothetical protein